MTLVLISSCSTNYRKYDYNQYFQTNEPFITVDSEEKAAQHIARKLARSFRRAPQQNIAILNFTDEYGDRLNRGVFFADMITSSLLYYRNPRVVERDGLYEIVKEQELSQTNLIADRGTELYQLVKADYIMSGRILRSRQEDMISVRCFRVGTGEVVYASTISIDYSPDPITVPLPRYPNYPGPGPYPSYPKDPGTGNIIIIDNSGAKDDTEVVEEVEEPEKVYKPKPTTGTEGQGKVNLNTIKKPRTNDDQYQYKKPPVTPTEPVKKPSSYSTKKSVTNTDTQSKKTETIVTKPEPESVNKKAEEPKEEPEVKKSSTTTSKKEKKISTNNTPVEKSTVLKK